MEWRIKLEATSGWGEVETIEVAHFKRRVVGLTAEEIGLEEAKQILADLHASLPNTSAPVSVQHASKRRQRDCRTLTIQSCSGR